MKFLICLPSYSCKVYLGKKKRKKKSRGAFCVYFFKGKWNLNMLPSPSYFSCSWAYDKGLSQIHLESFIAILYLLPRSLLDSLLPKTKLFFVCGGQKNNICNFCINRTLPTTFLEENFTASSGSLSHLIVHC